MELPAFDEDSQSPDCWLNDEFPQSSVGTDLPDWLYFQVNLF